MNKTTIAFLTAIVLCLITIIGDILIKEASKQKGFTGWKWLVLGSIIYGSTAIGSFFVMRKIELSNLGVIYSTGYILFLTLIGVIFYKEKVSIPEIFGICMAVISLFLLGKYS